MANKEIQILPLIQHALEVGNRCVKEVSYSEHERIGKQMMMYGATCTAAYELDAVEAGMKRTLLNPIPGDLNALASEAKALLQIWKDKMGEVSIYRNRDYQKYPKIEEDEIRNVRKKYEWVEMITPGKALPTNFDSLDYAYKMYDIIEMALNTIWKKLRSIIDDLKLMVENIQLRLQRWFGMIRAYTEEHWPSEKLRFLKRLERYLRENGDTKQSLQTFLEEFEMEYTDADRLGEVAILNEQIKNEKEPLAYLLSQRDKLSQAQLKSHMKFVVCLKLLRQRIELYDLRQSATGAYKDLFTCRAAQELVTTLVPTISTYVDFRHGYQYAAFGMAMMDLGLTDAEKRNGVQLMNFVNEAFKEDIEQASTLTRLTGKLLGSRFGELDETTIKKTGFTTDEYEKLKDYYWLTFSIINKVLGREASQEGYAAYLHEEHKNTPDINDFVNYQNEGVKERLATLKRALENQNS